MSLAKVYRRQDPRRTILSPKAALCAFKGARLIKLQQDKHMKPPHITFRRLVVGILILLIGSTACIYAEAADRCQKLPMQPDGITRLSKIEIYPPYLDEYLRYAAEVGEISLLTEPGVLAMYAMQGKDDPCRITILEIYASQDAYKSHINSQHFKNYKESTLKMVKSLILSDQKPINPANKITNFILGK